MPTWHLVSPRVPHRKLLGVSVSACSASDYTSPPLHQRFPACGLHPLASAIPSIADSQDSDCVGKLRWRYAQQQKWKGWSCEEPPTTSSGCARGASDHFSDTSCNVYGLGPSPAPPFHLPSASFHPPLSPCYLPFTSFTCTDPLAPAYAASCHRLHAPAYHASVR